jgi:hypothetical protein
MPAAHLGAARDAARGAVGVLDVDAVLIDVEDHRAELHPTPSCASFLMALSVSCFPNVPSTMEAPSSSTTHAC